MPRTLPLADNRILLPAQTALALELVSQIDLLRLKTLARLHARGLPPDVNWEDLLQEAITRMLVGSRKVPEGVSVIAFLAGVMRSLKAEHWRRVQSGVDPRAAAEARERNITKRNVELRDLAPDPERSLMARQELTAIEELFADDRVARQIIAGLAEGLSAEEICARHGLSKTDYNSARRRMRRTLLREGLTCETK
jgi:DNA-directed RNA polymerase specialized sigma24 family protein